MIAINVYLLEWRKEKSLYRWSSLGLQYIAAVLKSENHEVFSFVFENIEIEKIAVDIVEKGTELLGISLFRENINEMIQLINHVKELHPNIKVVVGGHTATLYPFKIMKQIKNLDFVMSGEGERIYPRFCNAIVSDDIGTCKGITYRNSFGIKKNHNNDLIENLDMLPFPDFDITRQMNENKKSYLFASVSTSRGCMGNCTFCVEHRVSKNIDNHVIWRGRSPENIVREIEELSERAGGKNLVINFVDGSIEDDDPENKKRLRQIIDLLEAKRIRLAFAFLTRAESWKEEDIEVIKRMKNVGLFSVSIGMESGSEDMLRIFGKRSNLSDNINAYKLFQKNGVRVEGFIIMFHPYATPNILRKTAETIKKCFIGYQIDSWTNRVYIYPDMRIFRKIVMDGLLIGTDKTGYSYEYGYIDGRIKEIYKVMSDIKKDIYVQKFNSTIELCQRAVNIFKVFDEDNCKYKKNSNIIKEFEHQLNSLIIRTSDFYYTQFISIVDSFVDLNSNYTLSINKWKIYAKENYLFLIKRWMNIEMCLAREGIFL